MPRPARVSPEKILAAAAREFAQRGYAGARVDRIARLARVNKAMLYYHFGSKQELYRQLLRDTFGAVASELEAIGLARAIAAARPPHGVGWHVQFHFPIFRGFAPDYPRQERRFTAACDALRVAAAAAAPHAITYHATTDDLAAEYERVTIKIRTIVRRLRQSLPPGMALQEGEAGSTQAALVQGQDQQRQSQWLRFRSGR